MAEDGAILLDLTLLPPSHSTNPYSGKKSKKKAIFPTSSLVSFGVTSDRSFVASSCYGAENPSRPTGFPPEHGVSSPEFCGFSDLFRQKKRCMEKNPVRVSCAAYYTDRSQNGRIARLKTNLTFFFLQTYYKFLKKNSNNLLIFFFTYTFELIVSHG